MRGVLQRRREPPPQPPPPRRFPRNPHPEHHQLTLRVVRGESAVAGAQVVVRPYAPDGTLREPVARATTTGDGAATLVLPAGRYAVSARHGGDARCVAVPLDRTGRVTLRIEPTGPRVVLSVEALAADGRPLASAYVEATAAEGHMAARGWTDERGVAALLVPPGVVEVRLGEARARVEAVADVHVRLQAPGVEAKPPAKPFPADPSLPPR